MARDPIFPLRLDAERRERWEAAAKASKVSLAEFVRQAVDAAEQAVAAGSALVAAAPKGRRGRAASAPRARTEMCEHRRPPDQHCSRCDD